MNDELLELDLMRDEGFVPYAYQDSLGFWTIGYGTLIDKRGGGLPEDICRELLRRHIREKKKDLYSALPWLSRHPERVQRALCNMAYQLGVAGLLKFKTTLDLVRNKRYEDAADNAMKSLWAREQTPERAKRVTDLLRGKP